MITPLLGFLSLKLGGVYTQYKELKKKTLGCSLKKNISSMKIGGLHIDDIYLNSNGP